MKTTTARTKSSTPARTPRKKTTKSTTWTEKPMAPAATPDWFKLLQQAVSEPGELAQAYKHFKQYSLANRWLASTQLRQQGLPLQPVQSFKSWLDCKRPVKKGETSKIALIRPITVYKKEEADEVSESPDKKVLFKRFVLRYNWFYLGQTEGEEYTPVEDERAEWRISAAMDFHEIKEAEFVFNSVSDKRRGYADGRTVSVSPMEPSREIGLLRQTAHVMLNHTADQPVKGVPASLELQAIEAETVVYLVGSTLGWDGLEDSRAIIQENLAASEEVRIPARSASRAFSVADNLINAGYA